MINHAKGSPLTLGQRLRELALRLWCTRQIPDECDQEGSRHRWGDAYIYRRNAPVIVTPMQMALELDIVRTDAYRLTDQSDCKYAWMCFT